MEAHICLLAGQVLAIMVLAVALVVVLALILGATHIQGSGPPLEVALLAKVIMVEDLVMITVMLIIQEIQAVAVALERLVLVAVIPILLLMVVLALSILYRELLLIMLVAAVGLMQQMMAGQVLLLVMVVLVGVEMVAVVTEQQILAVEEAVDLKAKTAVLAAVA